MASKTWKMFEGLNFCTWNMQLEHVERYFKVQRCVCHMKVKIATIEECRSSEEKGQVLMDVDKSGSKS